MKNLFNISDRDVLIERLSKIKSGTQRRWGTMSAHQMIVHLADPFRAALGDRPVPLNKSPFSTYPFNKLVSQILPWPKGAPTAPEFIQGKQGSIPAEFEKDKQVLLLLVHRFSQNNVLFPVHPTFGNLSNKEWSRVMWRHLNHHLNQFGL